MLPLVLCHINELDRLADGLHHRITQGLRLANYREDTAIVVMVPGVIQKPHAGLAPEAVAKLFNDRKVSALAEIWNAF